MKLSFLDSEIVNTNEVDPVEKAQAQKLENTSTPQKSRKSYILSWYSLKCYAEVFEVWKFFLAVFCILSLLVVITLSEHVYLPFRNGCKGLKDLVLSSLSLDGSPIFFSQPETICWRSAPLLGLRLWLPFSLSYGSLSLDLLIYKFLWLPINDVLCKTIKNLKPTQV